MSPANAQISTCKTIVGDSDLTIQEPQPFAVLDCAKRAQRREQIVKVESLPDAVVHAEITGVIPSTDALVLLRKWHRFGGVQPCRCTEDNGGKYCCQERSENAATSRLTRRRIQPRNGMGDRGHGLNHNRRMGGGGGRLPWRIDRSATHSSAIEKNVVLSQRSRSQRRSRFPVTHRIDQWPRLFVGKLCEKAWWECRLPTMLCRFRGRLTHR